MGLMSSPALRYPKSLPSYNPIPRGCVMYLPFWSKDLSGPVFKSVDSFGHICTVTGATYGSLGRTYDGVDDKIVIPQASSINNLATATYIAWLKFNTGYGEGTATYLFQKLGTAGYVYIASAGNVNDGKVFAKRLTDNTDAKGYSTDAISENVWTMLGITWSSTLWLDVYLQGTEVAAYDNHQQGIGNLVDDSGTDLTIGNRSDTTQTVDGVTGEVWWYNREFSAAEMLYIYNATRWRYQ